MSLLLLISGLTAFLTMIPFAAGFLVSLFPTKDMPLMTLLPITTAQSRTTSTSTVAEGMVSRKERIALR